MTKQKSVFKTIVVVLLLLFFVSAVASMFRGRTQTVAGTVNEQVESASGAFYLKLNGENELQVSEEDAITELGGEKTGTLTLDGGIIHVTGSNYGTIAANNGGTLVFKNTTIKDKTENNESAAFDNYIRFGGKLRFENCTLDSIYLKNDAQAEFVGCTFVSSMPRWYSVWVADGSASFDNCKFTGNRGLKINEFAERKDDVERVQVKNCVFEKLTEKVGIAIGTFTVNPQNTVVSVRNCRFVDNQFWDILGSIEGVDGMYEADMPTSEFIFENESNAVEWTGRTRKIRYVAFENGKEYTEIPADLWKKDGNYPTEYEVGKTTNVSELCSYSSSGENDFFGWYLDKACTVAFDGTIPSDSDKPLTIFAKISAGAWTDFY